jgi:hypothetical protein
MAIAWPDRIASIKSGNPLQFIYSKTGIQGIFSENTTSNWANKEKALIAMMDASNIVINGDIKGAPVANFVIQTSDYTQSKSETDIVNNIIDIRNSYDAQKKWKSLFAHLYAPAGSHLDIDSSSNLLNFDSPKLPEIFYPKIDDTASTEEEQDFNSSELYNHEIRAKPTEANKNKSQYHPQATKEVDISKFKIKFKWSSETRDDSGLVEGWREINGEPTAILSSIQSPDRCDEFFNSIKEGDKIDLTLKRPIIDMLSRKIIGLIAEVGKGIIFPIPVSNLSMEQNNPGIYRLEMQKACFQVVGSNLTSDLSRLSLLPELELDLANLIERKEVEAFVEKITTENIYFSIIGNNGFVHSAKQTLSRVTKILSELSIGEKVILSVENLIENKGSISINVRSALSLEDANVLAKYGIKAEKNQLFCEKPIPYEELLRIQDLLPNVSSDIRGLYALSHQLRVNVVEICRISEALQKKALAIKQMATENSGDTRTRIKEMHQEIKRTNTLLSSKSREAINRILDNAWNLSLLSEKNRRLSDSKSYLQHQEQNLAKNMIQLENARTAEFEEKVVGWIAETKEKISRVKEEIETLEYEINELKRL